MTPPESVWDYPRPPRIEPLGRRVRVVHGGVVVAESERALRVLETASPPSVYVPLADVRRDLLREAGGERAERAAWTYRNPRPGYEDLAEHVAFYPGRVDAACLDGERVRPQPGGFYGGWISDGIEGPFTGEPGTEGW